MAKFKVGDKVRLLKHHKWWLNNGFQNVTGDIVTVDENNSVCPWVINSDRKRIPVEENELQLVTEKKAAMFSIGDRVYVYGTDGDLKPIRRKAKVVCTDDGLLSLEGEDIWKPGCYDFTLVHPKTVRRIKRCSTCGK